jgi:hypothetical protein
MTKTNNKKGYPKQDSGRRRKDDNDCVFSVPFSKPAFRVEEGTRLLPLFATQAEVLPGLDVGSIGQMNRVDMFGGVCGFTPNVMYRTK